MMPDKFSVNVTKGSGQDPCPNYFDNFYKYCQTKADRITKNSSMDIIDIVIKYELKPHGKLIKTKTQGWYLRWDDEKYHTYFVLRWS
jgi:hypothetical protein